MFPCAIHMICASLDGRRVWGGMDNVCMHGWVPSLSTWNYYNTVDWLSSNTNFKRYFGYGPFLKFSLNLLLYCFCDMFGFFGCEACGNLAPWPTIKPATPALEGELLTIGPPEKSLNVDLKTFLCLAIYRHWEITDCFITQYVLYHCVKRLGNHQWGHGGRAYCTDCRWNGWGLRSYMFGESELHSPTEPAYFKNFFFPLTKTTKLH